MPSACLVCRPGYLSPGNQFPYIRRVRNSSIGSMEFHFLEVTFEFTINKHLVWLPCHKVCTKDADTFVATQYFLHTRYGIPVNSCKMWIFEGYIRNLHGKLHYIHKNHKISCMWYTSTWAQAMITNRNKCVCIARILRRKQVNSDAGRIFGP